MRDWRKLPVLDKESFLLAKAITKPIKAQEDISGPHLHEVPAIASAKRRTKLWAKYHAQITALKSFIKSILYTKNEGTEIK